MKKLEKTYIKKKADNLPHKPPGLRSHYPAPACDYVIQYPIYRGNTKSMQ